MPMSAHENRVPHRQSATLRTPASWHAQQPSRTIDHTLSVCSGDVQVASCNGTAGPQPVKMCRETSPIK